MEEILHYVWKFRLFDKNLITTNGQHVEVIDTGIPNINEGPDFFNAKVKIDGELWAGNIEIHTTSGDWTKHKHETNKNYNSVILHVVGRSDGAVYNQLGKEIPQCVISYPQHIDDNYRYLIHSGNELPCANHLSTLSAFHLNAWINTLLLERLERKADHISALLQRFSNSWEDAFYVLLARNFGFGLNSDSFERLALSLPLRYIQKQGDNFVQIEALLFGQAGMLNDDKPADDYYHLLQKEYHFLKNKYDLQALESYTFLNARARPTAFPQIRIAQLAALLYNVRGLFAKVMSCPDVGRIRLMFHHNVSEYWNTHYTFGSTSARKSKYLGDASLDIVIINTVSPMLFAYGKATDNEELCERALLFLETIKPEQNSITKRFAKIGMSLNNASQSQALIQLKREYCEPKKCMFCRIGHQLLVTK